MLECVVHDKLQISVQPGGIFYFSLAYAPDRRDRRLCTSQSCLFVSDLVHTGYQGSFVMPTAQPLIVELPALCVLY